MKKIFLLAVIAVMGLGTVGCSKSDDNGPSAVDYNKEIQGTWKDSKTFYLDKDRKVLGQAPAEDNSGCETDEIGFKGEAYILSSYFKNNQNVCESQISQTKFNVKGNILRVDENEDLEEYEIVELTGKKLVLLDLDKISESGVENEGWPKGTVYLQVEFTKK